MKKGQRRYKNWKSEGFPGWLQAKMAERGWNALRLAHEIEVVPSLISRWMSATQIPSVESLKALAHALQISEIEAMTAAGYLSPDEVTDDPRRLEILDRVRAVELTHERYLAFNGLLTSMEQASARSPHRDPQPSNNHRRRAGDDTRESLAALRTLTPVSG